MLAVFIVGVWLLLMRRRRTAQADKSNELHNEQKATVEMETDANRAEMETKDNYPELQSPVAELGSKGDLVELPGSDPREGHPPMELGVATRRHSSA